jgi:hypothetical protein
VDPFARELGVGALGVLLIEPRAGIAGAELGERAVAHPAAAARGIAASGAFEGVVVDDDQLRVAREPQVVLDPFGALCEREVPRGEGVFGGVPRGAAVGDHEWSARALRRLGKGHGERGGHAGEQQREQASCRVAHGLRLLRAGGRGKGASVTCP